MDVEHEESAPEPPGSPPSSSSPGKSQHEEQSAPPLPLSPATNAADLSSFCFAEDSTLKEDDDQPPSVSLLSSLTFPPTIHSSRQVRSARGRTPSVPVIEPGEWLPPAAVSLDPIYGSQPGIRSSVAPPSSSTLSASALKVPSAPAPPTLSTLQTVASNAISPSVVAASWQLPAATVSPPIHSSHPVSVSSPPAVDILQASATLPFFSTALPEFAGSSTAPASSSLHQAAPPPPHPSSSSIAAEQLSSVVSTATTSPSSLSHSAPSHGATSVLPFGPPTPRSPPPFSLPSTAASPGYSPSMSARASTPFLTPDTGSYISAASTPFLTPAFVPGTGPASQTSSSAPTLTSVASEPFKLLSQGSHSPKENQRKSRNPFLLGSSSSHGPPELARKSGAQTSLSPGSSARPRSCDVFIGLYGTDPRLIRYAKWMRAELELHGVACFSADRALYSDQRSHDIARRIMNSATFGVVLISRKVFKNPYTIEELTIFLDRKNLVPVFFDVAPSDCLVRDIIEKQGETWEVDGGELWKEYLGEEKGWSDAVKGLVMVEDWRVEAYEGNWRESIQKVVGLVGSRLGRRSIADREKVRGERAFTEEFPCPRNATFVGREKELKALERLLFFEGNPAAGAGVGQTLARMSDVAEAQSAVRDGEETDARRSNAGFRAVEVAEEAAAWPDSGSHPSERQKDDVEIEREREVYRGRDLLTRRAARGRPLQRERRRDSHERQGEIDAQACHNQACVTGLPGIGKSELALEFAYRNMQKYRMVLWVGGEARYLRQNYLNLSTLLGVDVGTENQVGPERGRVRSFDEQEADAVQRIRCELQKDIPYLLIIDNLEIERDWWDGWELTELLPRAGSATHVLITTRLSRVMHLEPLELSYLSNFEALTLMRGGKGKERVFSVQQIDKFKEFEDKLRRLPLGLAIIGKLISEFGMKPTEILAKMGKLDSKQASSSQREEAVLRSNPFLVKLLDVCFNLMGEASGSKHLATRMAWVGGWFGPAPCPLPLLGLAAHKLEKELGVLKIWRKCMTSTLSCCMSPQTARTEADARALLIKFGIARASMRQDCLYFHDIVQVYCRKRGGVPAARCFVRAVRKGGNIVNHYEHFWAAAFLVCRFASDPAVVEFQVSDLLVFTRRLVLPLALRAFNTFSRCLAALEVLRLCYVMFEDVEKSFVSQIQDRWDRSLCWRRGSSGPHQVDEYVWQDLTLLKALLLETRAKFMMRGGQFDAGEELCRTCISIRTVMLGPDHPDTISSQETLSKLVRNRNTM